jgi:4-diphosphocytidyl-2-C-methyl-D-erythritol kinase
MMRLRTVSKVNLSLRILGLLPDGRHELATWFQAIDYGDELELERSEHLSLECDDRGLGPQEENLAWKAADLLRRRSGTSLGARIRLRKKVPYGAGLGGGSGDAAAILVACNQLWELGWAIADLEALGRDLGADVPFLIRGGAAWATGAGDRLEPCPGLDHTVQVLVATPPVAVPTGWAYRTWDEMHPRPLQERAEMTNFPSLHCQGLFRPEELRGRLSNDFEDVVYPRFPEVERLRREIAEVGAAAALLSGSGSSVFGLFPQGKIPALPRDWVERGVRWRWCLPAAGPVFL